MNAISIAGLEPELYAWLRQQAAAHGVSLEEEAHGILRAARDGAASDRGRWNRLLAQRVILPPGAPTSTELLREDRDGR